MCVCVVCEYMWLCVRLNMCVFGCAIGFGPFSPQSINLLVSVFTQAFKLEFEASAPMGFKYAYCLYKNKQYVEAIDVCEKVVAMYPDYPRIREEILRKCIMGIRNFDR